MRRSRRCCTWPRRPSSPTGPTCCASSGCATASSWFATRSSAAWSSPESSGLLPWVAVRALVDHIAAPPFPPGLRWLNSAPLQMERQLGRPVLIEFWDFCRSNSIRTLPYMKAWHERYSGLGLLVIGVHASGFEPSRDPEAVRVAVARLGIPYPVVVDSELQIWEHYGNLGWPARYLWGQDGMLFEQHYGEGGYADTERAIQQLLGIDEPVLDPLRPEDDPEALLEAQSEDVEGPYSGPYRAGAVWAVLDGS